MANFHKSSTIHPIIDGWDIDYILSLTPNVSTPVHVLTFEGIPCSTHGAPLKLINGKYEVEKGKPFRNSHHEMYRTTGRIITLDHPSNIMKHGFRGNRYLIVAERNGIREPIMEVTGHGRSKLCSRQWAKKLYLAFDEPTDFEVPSVSDYNKLVIKLKHNLIV